MLIYSFRLTNYAGTIGAFLIREHSSELDRLQRDLAATAGLPSHGVATRWRKRFTFQRCTFPIRRHPWASGGPLTTVSGN